MRFAFAILLGMGVGYWLDKKFDLFPLFMVVGLIYGSVTGFLTIYRAIYPKDSQKDSSQKNNNE